MGYHIFIVSSSNYLHIVKVISSLVYRLFRRVSLNFQTFGDCHFVIGFCLFPLSSENNSSVLQNMLRLALWPDMGHCSKWFACAWKESVFCSFSWYFCLQSYHSLKVKFSQLNIRLGLPWWCSGWESACQCRGHGFEPWSGKVPRAAGRLGPWATTTEPARLEPVLRNRRGRDSERPAHRDEEWPPLAATGESPHTETKTQHSHK